MDDETKLLREAFLNKERNQELLARLERLRTQGSISAQKYDLLKSEYQQKITAAVSSIAGIKNGLKLRLEEVKTKLNFLNAELEELQARQHAGEFSLNQYHRLEKRLLKRIEATKNSIRPIQSLVDTKSLSQLVAPKTAFPRWALISTVAVVAILLIGLFTSWWAGVLPLTWLSQPTTPKWATIAPLAEPAVVSIQTDNVSCAGVVIDEAGLILTSSYIIKSNEPLTITSSLGAKYQCEVVETDEKASLAIIKVASSDNLSLPSMEIGDSEVLERGTKVAAIGYSTDTSVSTIATPGTILSVVEVDGITNLHTNIPFDSSRIGGALINGRGELIGILAGSISTDKVKDSFFAIAIDQAKPLIEQARPQEELASPSVGSANIDFSPSSFSFTATEGGANPPNETLYISNSGGDILDWSVSADAGWLSLSPSNGSCSQETDNVTLSLNIAGMSSGTYGATITISSTKAINTSKTVPVTLVINTAETQPKIGKMLSALEAQQAVQLMLDVTSEGYISITEASTGERLPWPQLPNGVEIPKNAKAGAPTLEEIDGVSAWKVPVLTSSGKGVGEMYVKQNQSEENRIEFLTKGQTQTPRCLLEKPMPGGGGVIRQVEFTE